MASDLNNFFVTFLIYKNKTQVHTMIVPKSLIHDMFQKWVYPGSEFCIQIIDHTDKLRIDTNMFAVG
jgi:hypothetical protein